MPGACSCLLGQSRPAQRRAERRADWLRRARGRPGKTKKGGVDHAA
ncbi:hypothetical protein [Acidocella sp.]